MRNKDVKNSSNKKYKSPLNLFINLYCILTLNHVECDFCLSDPRMYVQSSVRTEEWKCKKQEKAGQNSLDPLAFLAGFVDISSKPFFSLWLKKKKLSSWLFMHGLEELYCWRQVAFRRWELPFPGRFNLWWLIRSFLCTEGVFSSRALRECFKTLT